MTTGDLGIPLQAQGRTDARVRVGLGADIEPILQQAADAQAALDEALREPGGVAANNSANLARLRIQNAASDLAKAMVSAKLRATPTPAPKTYAIPKDGGVAEVVRKARETSPTLRRIDLTRRVKEARDLADVLVHLAKSDGLKSPTAAQAKAAIATLRDLEKQVADLVLAVKGSDPDAAHALNMMAMGLDQQVATLAALTVEPSKVATSQAPATAIATGAAGSAGVQPPVAADSPVGIVKSKMRGGR